MNNIFPRMFELKITVKVGAELG